MNKVFQFLANRISLITFIFLEILAFVLILNNNPYQGSLFINSANQFVGATLEISNKVNEYLSLKETNETLAQENAKLRFLLTQRNGIKEYQEFIKKDSVFTNKYNYVAAKVINNSTGHFHNYITINKGYNDSIKVGMGVISSEGIVGKVKSVSAHFATISSLLHKEMLVSSKLKSRQATGSVKWDGFEPTEARLMYIPRHIEIRKGDTVVTSEYNSVFPEGEMIGFVKEIKIKGDENFYNIKIKLSTDFNKLNYVYVIKNRLQTQLDSLEKISTSDKYEAK